MANQNLSNSTGEFADVLKVANASNAAGTNNSEIQAAAAALSANPLYAGSAISVDTVTAAGLNDLGEISLDADATISATSTAKSSASATNVSDDSAGLAFVDGNFGLNQADLIDVKSNAGLSSTAATTINADASTSKGDAAAMASLQDAAGIRDLLDLNVGGELTALGKAVNTITASAETVVGDTVGAQATAELFGTQQGFDASDINVSSNATVQGLSSLVNSATAAATSHGDALAEALGGDLIGANIDGIDVGGIANVTGQTTFGNTSKATNVEGDSTATSNLLNADGLISTTGLADLNGSPLIPTASFEVSSDATIKGLTSVTAAATAETTKGDATAASTAANINGADFLGLLDIGGVGAITGSASFNLAATASSVTPDDGSGGATAIAGGAVLSSQGLQGAAGANLSDTNLNNDVFGIDVASNATLSGTAIGTLKADASSTADDATARAGQSAELTGADIGSLHVGGVANLTGAAQLTSTAIAANVGDANRDALAESGLSTTTVTGLDASFMDVASDATITAQAFGTLNATATSTGGDATAMAGQYTNGSGESSTVLTGLETGLDLSIGGVGTLNALAQGSENASATTVDGIATASAGLDLNGAIGLAFASSSDGSLTGIAKLAATVDASSTANTAQANGDFSAIGFSGLDIGSYDGPGGNTDVIGIGGISTLKGQAQIAGTLNAESVSGDALAGVGDFSSSIVGMHNVVLNGASDGTILGTASGVFNTNAINIGGAGLDASAFSSQVLKGIDQIDLQLGGNGGISAIVNDQNFVTAHSVSGNATAVASVDAIGLNGGDMHIAGNASIMATVGVDSKSEAHTVA